MNITASMSGDKRQFFQSAFASHSATPVVGSLVQLKGWPENQWSEVILACEPGSADTQIKIVRYSETGDARYTQNIEINQVAKQSAKFDIPPMDFICGSVDVVDGKLGHARRRWPTKIEGHANIHISQLERLH